MGGIYLAVPDKAYQKSFQAYALAYKEIQDEHYYCKYEQALVDFDEYIRGLKDCARRRGANIKLLAHRTK